MQAQTRLTVQVQPKAKRNEVLEFKEGVLHLRIAAPPVKGKANRELIEFLSQLLMVSKSDIAIEKGMTAKRKVIAINGLSQSQLWERLGG